MTKSDWQHLCLTIDGGHRKYYRDGKLEAEVYINPDFDMFFLPFVLTPEEILQLYDAGRDDQSVAALRRSFYDVRDL